MAPAHRDKQRLVVDIQPDGDLMFDAGALWSAAKNIAPMPYFPTSCRDAARAASCQEQQR
ncbi:MAG TPA: hypothetical protein VMF32_21200 [Xanthobacteraceae bacterium]|nr:hypothetical protein [Xanthobacteraceae bacterium]